MARALPHRRGAIDRGSGERRKGKGHAKSVIDDLIAKGRAKERRAATSCRRITRPPT